MGQRQWDKRAHDTGHSVDRHIKPKTLARKTKSTLPLPLFPNHSTAIVTYHAVESTDNVVLGLTRALGIPDTTSSQIHLRQFR